MRSLVWRTRFIVERTGLVYCDVGQFSLAKADRAIVLSQCSDVSDQTYGNI